MRVQQKFPDARWDYIANPSGGFVGLWWHWKDAQDCRLYLQLRQEELCFKIQVKDETKRKQLRKLWSKKLLQQAINGELKVTEPDRFGSGQLTIVPRATHFLPMEQPDEIARVVATMHG